MIHFLKEHPWRSGALAMLLVLAAAVAIVLYLGRPAIVDHSQHAPAADEHAGHTDPHAGHTAGPTGFASFMLERSQMTAMGVTSEKVGERDFRRTVRTVGVVTVDETRTAHVHARVRGWIEGFHAQFVGQKVKKGQALISLYSQEVYAAELELASLVKSTLRSPELLDAARKRLALWEVPRSVIEQVEATGEPQRTFPVLAPRSGVIVAKQAFEGLFIDPSLELYTISDLSKVWVMVDIYEADVAHVQVGTEARLTIEGATSPVVAKVAFLYPTIDERTRTRKARFELANPDGKWMPGAFVTAELDVALDRGLAVPESAVIRTGTRSIVFVLHGTHVQPKEVKLGARVGDAYRVESGLEAGEVVATGAQFLLDSESRLKATSGNGGGHAGHGGH
ncbi:MAG TPA: efflux RND transporter periplasmic adaptor subunit [Kofleriaceae bacterium]|nr:efflux RND transporter periplasmic adaptor subunit [Kofleriaceae bacterium]